MFIAGVGRSGTTLMVDLLGLHPRLSPVYETPFVSFLLDLLVGPSRVPRFLAPAYARLYLDRWSRNLPHLRHSKREHERFHHGPHHVLFDYPFAMARTAELLEAVRGGRPIEGLRAFVDALFAEHARRDGKACWVNKTPGYLRRLSLLHRVYPEMRFIHCIRDGRDVACSLVTRRWGPRTFGDAAAIWALGIRRGLAFAQQFPDRYTAVRFENLLLQPAQEIRRLLVWLGEEGDPEEILAHYQGGAVRLDTSRIGEWERIFSPDDRAQFQLRAGDVLAELGYQ